MDIIEVGGRLYGVVITQDDAGAEIGLWHGDEQVATLVIEGRAVSAHEKSADTTERGRANATTCGPSIDSEIHNGTKVN